MQRCRVVKLDDEPGCGHLLDATACPLSYLTWAFVRIPVRLLITFRYRADTVRVPSPQPRDAGSRGGGHGTTLVFHRDHGQWVIQPTPSPAAGNPSLTGLSCGPADGCTAVGNTILPGDAGTLTTLAEHR